MGLNNDISGLYQQAKFYHLCGEIYHAIKLYKKLIKNLPNWFLPYKELGLIYKARAEWKPALHYSNEALRLNPSDKDSILIYYLSATGLNDKNEMKSSRLNASIPIMNYLNKDIGKIIPVSIKHNGSFEILWAKRIGIFKAELLSVPHPKSDLKYKDIVLLDFEHCAFKIVNNIKHKVYSVLQRIKLSTFQTFLVVIPYASEDQLDQLAQLCINHDLGFDNWNLLTDHQFVTKKDAPEFYSQDYLISKYASIQQQNIAIAATQLHILEKLLKTWKIITLQETYAVYKVS